MDISVPASDLKCNLDQKKKGNFFCFKKIIKRLTVIVTGGGILGNYRNFKASPKEKF
jgi:hypothetical protein